MVVIAVLVLVAAFGLPAALVVRSLGEASRSQKRREAAVERVALAIEPHGLWSDRDVHGELNGFRISFELTQREGLSWTEVAVQAGEFPAVIELRSATYSERRAVKRGAAVDVSLGDADFDRHYILEAAPADVVRRLLDEEMRRELLALRPLTLAYNRDDGFVRIRRPGWGDEDEALRSVELTVAVASRLSAIFKEVGRPQGDLSGSPYRPAADPSAARKGREQSAEVGVVCELQEERRTERARAQKDNERRAAQRDRELRLRVTTIGGAGLVVLILFLCLKVFLGL